MSINPSTNRVHFGDKTHGAAVRQLEKMQENERNSIVDAFMENAPILSGKEPEVDLSNIEVLRGDDDGKLYYRHPRTGTIQPLPEGLVEAMEEALLKKKTDQPCSLS